MRRTTARVGLLLTIGLGSVLAYVAVAATINGQASVSPFPGWVAVLQRGLFEGGDQVSVIVAPVTPGGAGVRPELSYNVVVCGTHRFAGVLLLGGAARLTQISTSPSRAEEAQFPTVGTAVPHVGDVSDMVITQGPLGDEQVFNLGRVQVVDLTFNYTPACPKKSVGIVSFGESEGVTGRVLAPVERYWSGPWGWWYGPHSSEVWPLVGAFPGPSNSDGGTFNGFRGLDGPWTRPPEMIEVSAGGLTARATVDTARPALSDSSGLNWSSYSAITPEARITNTDDLAGWQQDLLPAGVALGIGGALLSSLLFEWLRPRPHVKEAPRPGPPPITNSHLQQPVLQSLARATLVAAILAVAIRKTKSGSRPA
jgi:hypothetical protein